MDVAVASGTFLVPVISIHTPGRVRQEGFEVGARSRRTSKKFSPALCTSIRSSSEPGVGTGSGASYVSWSLDGCAYSVMTSAFIF